MAAVGDGGAVILESVVGGSAAGFITREHISPRARRLHVQVRHLLIFYLIGGCFLDALALDILTIPIFYPVILALGYDIIWFGVMIVVVTMMGVITPPVGVCVYVVAGMARDVPMENVFRGSMPFLWMLVLAAVLFTAFPQIVTFLPDLMTK